MKAAATKCEAPEHSAIASRLQGAYFYDAWSIATAEPNLSALGQFLRAASATPGWVNGLMSARNRVVSALGLKDLGSLSALNHSKSEADYKPGDRVGIFTLIENRPDETLLGDNDKHLEVVLSVHRAVSPETGAAVVTVTTVVHVHNWLGRLYMLPVAPVHKIIVPSVLKAIARPPEVV